jgi:hypothetical protein
MLRLSRHAFVIASVVALLGACTAAEPTPGPSTMASVAATASPTPTATPTPTASPRPSPTPAVQRSEVVALQSKWLLDVDFGLICEPFGPLVPVRCNPWGDVYVELNPIRGWDIYSSTQKLDRAPAPPGFVKMTELAPDLDTCVASLSTGRVRSSVRAEELAGGVYLCVWSNESKVGRLRLLDEDACESQEPEPWVCVEYLTWVRPLDPTMQD